jgi:hypothetical protein
MKKREKLELMLLKMDGICYDVHSYPTPPLNQNCPAKDTLVRHSGPMSEISWQFLKFPNWVVLGGSSLFL